MILSIVILVLFSLYVTYNTENSLIESGRNSKDAILRMPRPLLGGHSGDQDGSENLVQQRNILEGIDQEDETVRGTEKPPIETTPLYKYIQQVSRRLLCHPRCLYVTM